MAPEFIADSDGDEPELDHPSHIPANNVEQSKSSHGIDHQAVSTAPSFFNGIFNEEQDASREPPQKGEVIDSEEEGEATDGVSFDQGFHRVATAEAHVEKSLWDVPSSPESMKPKRFAKENKESNPRTKMTRGLRRQLDDIGYISPDDQPATRQITNKRRRIQQAETDTTDDLVPTLPADGDECISVGEAVLPSSQRKQHSTVRLAAFSSPTQSRKSRNMKVESSGSATNINTPREGLRPLAKAPSPEKPNKSASNDPDVAEQRMSPPPRSTSIAVKVGDEYVPGETEEGDASHQEEPKSILAATTKKSRGRHKKMVEAPPANEEGVVAIKVNKRRGRPKKSAKAELIDDDKADDEDDASTDMKTMPEVGSPSEQQPLGRDSASPAPAQVLEPMEKNMESKLQSPETPTRRAESTDGSVLKDVMDKKAAAATPNSSGRQTYRVGLSKRTKIAPLLKVIRK